MAREKILYQFLRSGFQAKMIYREEPKDFDSQFEIAICFFEVDSEILLLLRQPWESSPNKWCLPGGGLEKNETALEAVVRECREETGIKLPPSSYKFLVKVYERHPDYDFVVNIFTAKLSEKSEVRPNHEEHADFKWVTPEEAFGMDLISDGGEAIKIFQGK